MNYSEYFDFEDRSDFPIYKDNSFFNIKNLSIVIISLILFVTIVFIPFKFYEEQEYLMFFFVMIIPVFMLFDGKLNCLFKKPKISDLKIVVLSFLSYILFMVFWSIINNFIPNYSMYFVDTIPTFNILTWLASFLQIIGEDLFRTMLFLLLLYISYNYSDNRKKSIIFSLILSLIVFAILHINYITSLPLALLLEIPIGLFIMIPYIKTKNIILSFIVHIMINVFSWSF